MSQLTYSLSFPHPASHYVEVEMLLENISSKDYSGFIELKMPVWTPGSYLVREYAKNVEGFGAWGEASDPLTWRKTNKNTWQIELAPFPKILKIAYKVYSFEISVRNNFVDESHALIVGANTFMYLERHQNQKAFLEINLPSQWKNIETALPRLSAHRFEIPDFDTLIDSPLELGNAPSIDFEVGGIPHRHVLYGLEDSGLDSEQFIKDTQAIVQAAQAVFGENPCKNYLFVTHFLKESREGLEHKDCTILHFPRVDFGKPEGYKDFLSLAAHEYFHVWNIKRLRPEPLGPFDYSQENYTTLLWQVEGFTSYFEKLILYKSTIIDEGAYLETLSKKINYIENQPGMAVQSLAEASWDAWIKAYRPNENSPNATISYYAKGAVIALLLDAFIIRHSQAQNNLNTVMQKMYQHYYKELDRPFTEAELKAVLEETAQSSLDSFFEAYIYQTKAIEYAEFLEPLGLILQRKESEETKAEIGITLQENKITFVKRSSVAERDGLNVGDTFLAINEIVPNDFAEFLENIKPSESLNCLVNRNGLVKEITLNADKIKEEEWILSKLEMLSPAQKSNQDKFLRR
jgi:predicted metalloprotease with PDZ domain